MPKYKVDITLAPSKEDVKEMLGNVRSLRDRALIVILWVTGARPSEVLMLRKDRFEVSEHHGKEVLFITLDTLKIKKGDYFIPERTLPIPLDTPFVYLISKYLEGLGDNKPLFNVGLRRVEQIISKASNKKFCPYNFRHGRMNTLDATISELMYWKGSKTTKSVENYLRNKPIKRVLEIE